jgi:hypothetical protein
MVGVRVKEQLLLYLKSWSSSVRNIKTWPKFVIIFMYDNLLCSPPVQFMSVEAEVEEAACVHIICEGCWR